MKSPSLFSVLILATLLFVPAVSQAEPGARLGVVDMDRLLSGSRSGQALLVAIDEMVKGGREEAARMDAETLRIRDQAIALTKASSPANQRALLLLQMQFNNHLANRQRHEFSSRQLIDQQRFHSLAEFNAIALPVIQALGKEQGYTLILRKRDDGVLYAAEAADLTGEAIKRLDALAGKK